MNKLLPLLVVGLLVLSGLGAVAFPYDAIKTDVVRIKNEISTISTDESDQYQTVLETAGIVGQFPIPPYWNVYVAQSFIPQIKYLTRVQLRIGRNATATYPYVLAIRGELTGENIAESSVSADDIPIIENLTDMEWIEFVFDDVQLTVNQTYYMVSYTTNQTDNYYGWGASLSSLYPNGTVFVSMNGGETWAEESDNDMCFMTYGKETKAVNRPLFLRLFERFPNLFPILRYILGL